MIDKRYKVWCDAMNVFNHPTSAGCEAEIWIKTKEYSLPHTSELPGKTFTENGSDIVWHILSAQEKFDPENSPRVKLCLGKLEDNVNASNE